MIVLAARWALHGLALHSGTPCLIPEITAMMRQAAALRAENAAYTQLARFRSFFAASSAQHKGAFHLQSYVHGACNIPLLGDTIGYNLTRTAEEHPHLLAVSSISQQKRMNYQDFYRHVMNTAQGLLGVGVASGDRVAILSPNSVEWITIMYATAMMGAILVPLNPSYTSAELQHALQHCKPKMLIAASSSKRIDLVQRVYAATGYQAASGQRLPLHFLSHVLFPDAAEAGNLSWEDLQAAGSGLLPQLTAVADRVHMHDPAQIQYTSGTTGKPKGVTLSHHSLLNNGYFIGRGNRFQPHDKVCLPVPLFHCFGCVLGALAITSHGASMVFPGEGFDARQTLQAVQQEQCTALYGVPTMFIAQLALPDFACYDLSSLRKGIMAGSPCPQDTMQKVMTSMHMSEVTICYGMTETSPVSFQTSPSDPVQERVSTVGRVHPHVQAKVVDPDSGMLLPRGAPGELCTRGYSLMLGYWDDEAATAQVLDQASWLHTGDMVVLDEKGYCRIVGRLKDMIIRGGENISPREVEEVIHQHKAVMDVQVIGIPHDKYGEEVCAWVRIHPGCNATAEQLTIWCKQRLAAFKLPRTWKFVENYPMTASGKVQKYVMRQQHIENSNAVKDDYYLISHFGWSCFVLNLMARSHLHSDITSDALEILPATTRLQIHL